MDERPRLIVHAGMGKAGSTAIQLWLGEQATGLGEVGAASLRWCGTARTGTGWERVASGSAGSEAWRGARTGDPFESHPAFLQSVLDLGDECRTVVVSAEAVYDRLHNGDPALQAWLDGVAALATVEVVFYVRPQHRWVEAAWRQWGFRSPMRPREWIAGFERHLDYRWFMAQGDPLRGTTVRLHPVVDGPSGRTDVVEHFATTVLGLPHSHPSVRSRPRMANLGLPLEVCVALWRDRPAGLWGSEHDNLRLDALKLLLDVDVQRTDGPDPLSVEFLRDLHGWAAEHFGAANEEFLAAMEWDAAAWPLSSAPGSAGEAADAIDRLVERHPAQPLSVALARHVERLVAMADTEVAELIHRLR